MALPLPIFFVYDSPIKHPRISSVELDYLKLEVQGISPSEKTVESAPYLKILTCRAVWAIMVGNCADCLNYAIPTIVGTTYLDEIHHLKIRKVRVIVYLKAN